MMSFKEYVTLFADVFADLESPQWSSQERECIGQLKKIGPKKWDKENKAAVKNLHWRLEQIKNGTHVRIKPHWEY